MSDAILAALCSTGASVILCAVAWGTMTTKISRLERDQEKMEEKFVTLEHFKDTIRPMRDQMSEIRQDIKSILLIVSKNEPNRKNRPLTDN